VSATPGLAEKIQRLGITRLCHLTPSRNLVHIASDQGIRSTSGLEADERAVFTPQDRARIDRRRGHISCSIQYPNAWYFGGKKNPVGEAVNFRDWVVLGIAAKCMTQPDTLFSPVNAATAGGAFLVGGLEGFEAMYAPKIVDGSGRTFERTENHLPMCPTNNQAEVMIPRAISLEDITTIFVPDTAQAARQHVALEQIGAEAGGFRYVIASDFFNAYQLSANIRDGIAPTEIEWNPPS
jgi:hypothetical protein